MRLQVGVQGLFCMCSGVWSCVDMWLGGGRWSSASYTFELQQQSCLRFHSSGMLRVQAVAAGCRSATHATPLCCPAQLISLGAHACMLWCTPACAATHQVEQQALKKEKDPLSVAHLNSLCLKCANMS